MFSLRRWNLLGSKYILFEERSHVKKLNKKEDNVLLSLIVQVNRKESCILLSSKKKERISAL